VPERPVAGIQIDVPGTPVDVEVGARTVTELEGRRLVNLEEGVGGSCAATIDRECLISIGIAVNDDVRATRDRSGVLCQPWSNLFVVELPCVVCCSAERHLFDGDTSSVKINR